MFAQYPVVANVLTDTQPVGIAVNPTTNRIYIAGAWGGTRVLTVVDGARDSVVARIILTEDDPVAVAVNPATNRIYIARHGVITVVDGASDAVVANISTKVYFEGFSEAFSVGPVDIAVNPATNRIYIAGYWLMVVDGTSDSVVANIFTDTDPVGIAVNPATNRIFIAGFQTTFNTRWLTVVDGAMNFTPTGTDVVVQPVDSTTGTAAPVTLKFSSVTQAGETVVTSSSQGPPPPTGFKLTSPPVYYEITTTAVFAGSVRVCVSWAEGQISDENNVRLFHREGNQWFDITDTSSLDKVNNTVCGTTTSLSPFTLFEELGYKAAVQQPIKLDGSSVFNAKRGVVPVIFKLTLDGNSTCTLPPATLLLTRTSGEAPGAVTESDYVLASDDGTNFRIQDCQYIYNLATGSLGPGSYRVDIKIGDSLVGSATFALN